MNQRKPFFFAFLFFTILYTSSASAQPLIYTFSDNIKVYDQSGMEQSMPWGGGFNKPQFAMGDLNNDHIPDLVVFETWKEVRTFINKGTAGNPKYVYDPRYQLNFPPVTDYLVLADYNRDGIPDLFMQQSADGFLVYKGYYNSKNQLCFHFYKTLNYSNDTLTNGIANAYNNPGDIPAIVDVDGDGDLDFISYNVVGGNMNWYRNMQVEYSLPPDSISIKLWDRCWGKVYQGWYRTHTLQYECSNAGLAHRPSIPGAKITHSGNAPCLFDYDMDGDYDYLDGSVSFNEMTFLLNGRIPYNQNGPDSMVYQDTLWQSNGKQIEIPVFPAAFNVDIDQDGKKDLLIAPNTDGENYKCVWFYKNYTTPGNPSWVFKSDTLLIDQTIDLGTAAYPQLFDFNKDGKPDLFVGSDGYYQANGTLRSRMSFYLNTSTIDTPSFTLQTKDFLGLNVQNFKGIAPAFGDLDNDGISDMVIGHTDGTITFLKNSATSQSAVPQWNVTTVIMQDMYGNNINVGAYAAPFIYDLDKDGKPDLIVGAQNGYFAYYRNMSTTPGQLKLKLVNSGIGAHARVDPNFNSGNYSTPFIGKIDSTGKDYLLSGANSGLLYRFTGFQNGDSVGTMSYPMLDSQYAYIDTQFNYYNAYHPNQVWYDAYRTAPTVGDIDGDGKDEMIVGDIFGGLKMYRQLSIYLNVPIITSQKTLQFSIYPNPASNTINLVWNTDVPSPDLLLSIYNIQGQQVYSQSLHASMGQAQVSVAALTPGIYISLLQSGNSKAYNRFTVIR